MAPKLAKPAIIGCALIGSLVCFSFSPETVGAAQRQLGLGHVSRQADHIFVGIVLSTRAYRDTWPDVGKVVFTDVKIKVTEEWKGAWKDKIITLQVPGGVLPDGSGMGVSGAPVFAQDERVLVFSKAYNGREWVYGWEQGKYTLVLRRVVGRPGFPISSDILSPGLKRSILKLLREDH